MKLGELIFNLTENKIILFRDGMNFKEDIPFKIIIEYIDHII